MKRKVLDQSFFDRPTTRVAQDLLGIYLVRRQRSQERAYKIIETEAYDGQKDKASHAHRGRTARTEVLFGRAGIFYIYFVYGMHEMLNIVTGPQGFPAAVLIRGVEGIIGPGRLTRALSIGRSLSGKKAIPKTGLWFEDRGERVSRHEIEKGPRIGVAYAGYIWSQKPYRFILKGVQPK